MDLTQHQWTDVSLNNLVEEIKSLMADDVDVSRVFIEAEDILGEPGPWTVDRFVDRWVTLDQYNALQHILVQSAGHVEHLYRAGQNASQADLAYGNTEGLKRLATNWLLRWFSSPAIGIALINSGTKNYNSNKTFDVLAAKPGEVLLKLSYVRGPDGTKRKAEHETRSVLDRIRGVLESIERMWRSNVYLHKKNAPHPGDVTYLTVDIRPHIRLQQEWPEADYAVTNTGLVTIDGKVYGKLIDLYPHPQLAGHLLPHKNPTDLQVPTTAILIEKDVITQCGRTGARYPIMRAGEIYRHDEPIDTIIKIEYNTNWWRRTWDAILGTRSRLRITSRANLHKRIRETQARLTKTEQREEEIRKLLEKILNPPNETVFRQFALAIDQPGHPDAFKALGMKTAVMFADLEGFTLQSKGVDSEKLFKVINTYHDMAREICFRHDALIYKTIGDGFMAVFPLGWAHDTRDIDTRGLIKKALDASQDILSEINKNPIILPGADKPVHIRIGINAGTSTVGTMGYAPDAIGEVVNFAARAESAAGRDAVVLTNKALNILLDEDEQKLSHKLSVDMDLDIRWGANYIFENKGVRQVKKDEVHIWNVITHLSDSMANEESIKEYLRARDE